MIVFHSNLHVIRVTASCFRLGMRLFRTELTLFRMPFAYNDLVAGRFAKVQFANVLRRFANVFSPILMAHCVHIELQNTFLF